MMTPLELEDAVTKVSISYDELVAATEKDILLKNKLLKDANNSQVDLTMQYGKIHATVDYLEHEAESLKEQLHSYAYTVIIKGAHKVMSTDAKKMADVNTDYIEAVKIYNKVYK
ncbi:MAG: hypothetical protein ACREAN_05380, partial [Nitrosopumilaceae archaeon]